MRFVTAAFLLAACGSSSTATEQRAPEPQDAVPDVAGNGYGAVPADRVEVVVSKTSLVVDGKQIVAIANGAPDPSEIEGGAVGIKINRLASYATSFVKQYAAEHPGQEPTFLLSVDPTLTYRLLTSTMFSIKQAPTKHFALVARSGGRRVALPITLPDKRPISSDEAFAYADRLAFVGGTEGDMSARRPGKNLADEIDKSRNAKPPITITKQQLAPGSSLTGDIVKAKILSVYAAGLERCARSKPGHHVMGLRFGIVDGRVDRPVLTGETGEIADCVGGQLAGWRFPLAKDPNGTPVAVTATLEVELDVAGAPTAPPAPKPVMTRPEDVPLGLFVSVTKDKLIVWSISGLEGTLQSPRATIKPGPKAMTELSTVLGDIVRRRWSRPDQPRATATKTIVIQADGATPIQTVADVMGAMRAGADGRELFPDIQLSSGFE